MTEVRSVPVPAELREATELVAISEEHAAKIRQLVRKGSAMQVRDAESFAAADALNGEIRELSRAIEDQRKELSRPALDLQRTLKAVADEARAELQRATQLLSKRLHNYTAEQERKQREAAAEAERARARREAEEMRKPGASVELLPPEGSVPATVEVDPVPKAKSVRTRRKKTLVIHDVSKIPATFGTVRLMVPDEQAIKKLLEAGVDVPGCSLVEERAVTNPGGKVGG